MIGIVDVQVQAQNPSMPLYPMNAYVESPTSIRVRNVPKKIGSWNITSVAFTVAYPDGSIVTAPCKLVGGVWVGTVEGSTQSGKSTKGYTIFASGTDENGNAVSDYVLGKGDVIILESDGTITPGVDAHYVHLLSSESSTPKDGDLFPNSDGTYSIWQNGQAHNLAGMTSADLDDTLTLSGKAADAKATGDAVSYVDGRVNLLNERVESFDNSLQYAVNTCTNINAKIPQQTWTPDNELADKSFVNSSVQTATANFRGNWSTWEAVPEQGFVDLYPADYAGSHIPTVNDYLVVQDASDYHPDSQTHLVGTWRFKYSGVWSNVGKSGWQHEYQVNETPMTAAQLAALNSGITQALVAKFNDTTTKIYNTLSTQYIDGDGDIYELSSSTTEDWTLSSVPEGGLIYDWSVVEDQSDDKWYYYLYKDGEFYTGTPPYNEPQTQVQFYVTMGAGEFTIYATKTQIPSYSWYKTDEIATKSYVGNIEAILSSL